MCKKCDRCLDIQGLRHDEKCICLECRVNSMKSYEDVTFEKEFDCIWSESIDSQ